MCVRIKNFITKSFQVAHARFSSNEQGIPDKGKLLTQISLFLFDKLAHIIPNHVVTANVDEMPEEVRKYKDQVDGRSILVKKAEVIPLEAIVRGYITGMREPEPFLFCLKRVEGEAPYFTRICLDRVQESSDCAWYSHAQRSC